MRHRLGGRHLGRETSHRLALYRNLVTDLLRYERITTTEAKAKEIRPMAEKIITLGRRGDLHSRRQAQRFLYDPRVVKKVFDDIGPKMADRPGGYLRITALEPRKGDGARMSAIELVTYVNVPPTPRPARVTAAPSAILPAAPVAAAPATVEAGPPPSEAGEASPIVDEMHQEAAEASVESSNVGAEAEAAQAADAEAADAADVHKGEGESGT